MIDRQAAAWAGKMLLHPKASNELRFALNTILPVMTDSTIPRDGKKQTLSMMVDELSKETFKLKPVAEQIMVIINMKEDVCKEYPDSESQVDGILEWLPRFKQHRGLLLKEVKNHRKQYGLAI